MHQKGENLYVFEITEEIGKNNKIIIDNNNIKMISTDEDITFEYKEYDLKEIKHKYNLISLF